MLEKNHNHMIFHVCLSCRAMNEIKLERLWALDDIAVFECEN